MTPEELASHLPNYRRIEVCVAICALVFLLVLLETIRRRRLKERYALLWILMVIVTVVFTVRREWLETMSYGLGIHHTPSALLLVLVGFVMLILFHFSTVLSRLLDDRTTLTQQVALLDVRCRELRSELDALRGERDPSDPSEAPGSEQDAASSR